MTVAEAGPTRWLTARPPRELALRIASAVVLAPLAVAVAYVGGWLFVLFWGVAAAGVLYEWISLVEERHRRSVLMTAIAPLVFAVVLVGADRPLAAVVVLAVGTLAVAALAPKARRLWAAGSVSYAGTIGIAPVVLRSDPEQGFVALLFLYAVVWSTDIAAYFVGRIVGGRKLMPAVSPKKTWSGAIGGTVAAIAAAIAIAAANGQPGWFGLVVVAAVLSIMAQAGDLFESWFKRCFGAKDSGHIIPGHGGLMDRLDGFVVAAGLAAVIGLMRGGIEMPGRGLMVW